MPSIYQPRRPRASPLWQLVQHGWDDFLSDYEKHHRKSLGPLRPTAVATVQSFLRCGDLAAGFTRLQCPDSLRSGPTPASGASRQKQTPRAGNEAFLVG